MNLKGIFILMFSMVFFCGIYAIEFEHITTEDGLPNSFVRTIVQDNYGYMWLGTDNGLCKYDGFDFTVFKDFQKDEHVFDGNRITSLAKFGKDTLLVGLVNGLCVFNVLSEEYEILYFKKQKVGNHILSIFIDNKNEIWVGTINGIFNLDISKKQFTHFPFDRFTNDPVAKTEISGICQDKEKRIWFTGYGNKIFLKDGANTSFVTIPKKYITDSAFLVPTILVDKYNRIWLGTSSSGVLVYNHYRASWEYFSEKYNTGNLINSLFMDKSGAIWIGTDKEGLFRYQNGNINKYTYDCTTKQSISSNTVFSIAESEDGVLWFGTPATGVNKLKKTGAKFKSINGFSNALNANGNFSILTINTTQKGEIIVGTDGEGLGEFKDNAIVKLDSDDSRAILSSSQTTNYDMLLGTHRNGLFRYENKCYSRPKFYGVSLFKNECIPGVLEDNKGDLWILRQGRALSRYDNEKNSWLEYNSHNSIFENTYFKTIFEDSKGRIWIGLMGSGLYLYNRETDSFESFLYDNSQRNSIKGVSITCIFEDSRGQIWVGTEYGGINILKDRNSKSFVNFTIKDGLPDNTICGILEDKSNNIWISTKNGLSKYNVEKRQFENFTQKDGIANNEFNTNAQLITSDEKLLFGGINGLTIINTDSIYRNEYASHVGITDFKILSKDGRITHRKNCGKTIIVPADHAIIEIAFVALDYNSPKATRYKYKLEGYDEDWIEVNSDNRIAVYTNLGNKQYIFKVIGSSSDLVWNHTPLELNILVKEKFWSSIYSRLGIMILILLGIYGAYKYRIKNHYNEKTRLESEVVERSKIVEQRNFEIQQKIEQLEIANKTKDNFMSIIAQDLKNPLNILLGFTDYLNEGRGGHEIKKERLDKIYEAVNSSTKLMYELIVNLLDWVQIQSGNIFFNAQKLNLYSVVNDGIEFVLDEANKKQLKIANAIADDVYVNADIRLLQRILKNILGSSVKFSKEKGTIAISAKASSDEYIEITIKDNGIGLTKEQKENMFKIDRYKSILGAENDRGTGLGLIVSKEYIEINGGILKIKSELGRGSDFIFYLPKSNCK